VELIPHGDSWEIKKEVLNNPKLGVIVNAANEVAIERFIQKDIGFMDIPKMIIWALERFENRVPNSLEDVFALDSEIRRSL